MRWRVEAHRKIKPLLAFCGLGLRPKEAQTLPAINSESKSSLSVIIISQHGYNRIRMILFLLMFVLKDHDPDFPDKARIEGPGEIEGGDGQVFQGILNVFGMLVHDGHVF